MDKRDNTGQQDMGDISPRFFTLRVELIGGPTIKREDAGRISRTIRMRADQTLDTLHKVIFDAFDRSDERLYEFNLGTGPLDTGGKRYTAYSHYEDSAREEIDAGDAAGAAIDSLGLTEGRAFSYWFDFADNWVHRVEVVAIEETSGDADYPSVIERQGESPPQYLHPDSEDDADGALPGGMPGTEVMMEYLQAEWREEVEQKTVLSATCLQAALNKLPAIWVEAICSRAGLPEVSRKKERVKALVEHLPRDESLATIWNNLPEASRRMLKWIVMDHEGAAAVSRLSEEFGPDMDRSWFWHEGDTPVTSLGLLRLNGLVFVGMTKAGRGPEKHAVVPMELRDGLRRLAGAPDAFEDAPPLPAQPDEDAPQEEVSDIEAYLREIVLGGPQGGSQKRLLESMELEAFLEAYPFSRLTEWMYCIALGEISARPRDFRVDSIGDLLDRMIKGGKADTRLMAYKLGTSVFGSAFAQPALQDRSGEISAWAEKALNSPVDE